MECCLDPILYLEDILSQQLEPFLGESSLKLSGLQVKRKPNQHGDIHIAAFTRHMAKYYNKKADQILSIIQEITSSPPLNKYINDVNIASNGQLNLCLDKVSWIKAVLCNVITNGIEYGMVKNLGSKEYLLNASMDINIRNQDLTSLDCLRVVVTVNHLNNLLHANGVSSNLATVPQDIMSQSTIELLSLFNDSLMIRKENHSDYQEIAQHMEKSLNESQFICKLSEHTSSPQSQVESVQSSDGISVEKDEKQSIFYFDCQKYRETTHLHSVAISKSLIQKLSALEMSTRYVKGDCCQVVHVTSHRHLYTSQQHGLAWEALSSHSLSQMYLALGKITAHNNQQQQQQQQQQQIGVEELLSIRENQVRSAYLSKYGDTVQGQGWDDSIKSVAIATLKLQIMAASQNNQVRIDVSKEAQDFRQSTFILYNCARLAKLFQHYEQNVQQGLYPPLPEIDKVDFSLLREKDEWNLVLRYITTYPSVVRDSVHGLLATSNQGSLVSTNINKICCFLLDLSQDFSSYYGRTHVLGEPRPHLFPTMFARLYLLKALQQVFHNCLALLDIQPLTQM